MIMRRQDAAAQGIWQRRLLALLLLAAFALGGGARGDIMSLVLLRPLAFLILACGLISLTPGDIRRFWLCWLFALLIAGLTLLHLVPLPASLWHGLPGRGLMVQADQLIGLPQLSRPLAMVPSAASNALFSLVVPVTALALISQSRSGWFGGILAMLCGISFVDAMFSLLQIAGPEDNFLYFYRITNSGSAVGLFANRNHNAVFLAAMLPALALYAMGGKAPARGRFDWRPLRRAFALICGTMAVLAVMISGSRAGLIAAVAALLAIPFVIGSSFGHIFASTSAMLRRAPVLGAMFKRAPQWLPAAIVGLLAALIAVTVFALPLILGSSSALGRFVEEDSRSGPWRVIWGQVRDYFPWGSGIGSFPEIYQIAEPPEFLSETYLNHAHNDFLEVALTAGLPGMLLMGAAAIALVIAGLRLLRQRGTSDAYHRQARLGLIIVCVLSFASLVDYPLRTPALACLFVVAIGWLVEGLDRGGVAIVPSARSEDAS